MISDSSTLIIFAKINKLDLLKKLYGKIQISETIYKEIVDEGEAKGEIVKNSDTNIGLKKAAHETASKKSGSTCD